MSIVVLKFGSSVLKDSASIPDAVHEIYRWYRAGRRVVAVVSAIGRTTDDLLARARSFGERPDAAAVAHLLATGESTSAALVALALDRAGVPAGVLDPSQVDLRTRGEHLESEAVSVNTRVIEEALSDRPVAVIPGFFGRRDDGALTLLGRGGSDLTAIFLARELGAERCRLVKDVDGLYEHDPARSGPPPKRFRTIHFDDALALDGRIVQHKSVRWARERGYAFEVGRCQEERCTIIHAGPTRLEPAPVPAAPLKIGLLGLGTVGRGVYAELERIGREEGAVEVVGAAVREPRRHAGAGVPAEILSRDAETVVRGPADLIVEALGGVTAAPGLIALAAGLGKPVVTANKAALVRLDGEVPVAGFSASVGGAAPIIERACHVAHERGVRSIEGVLNGTTNFILDRLAEGAAFDEAVKEAQIAGFAESDPTTDLDGTDAAHKLCVLARAVFGTPLAFEDVIREGITGIDPARVRAAADAGCVFRLVARVRRAGGGGDRAGLVATVEPRVVAADHPFAQARQEWNAALITPFEGEPELVR
ncbi:MAG: homoserine dehydrogenase, partial [Phycisphaerales bacterium]